MDILARATTFAVTGGSGFVGGALLDHLRGNSQFACRALYRTSPERRASGLDQITVGDLGDAPLPPSVLAGVDIVVHTAARTHNLWDHGDPYPLYRKTNVDGTMNLARAAVAAGVRRLVFISSIKVNGEATPPERPFTEADAAAPQDAYGVTKHEAEQALWRVSRDTGIEVVVLRPPLIYGPGVKGNLRRLTRLLATGVPLPLAAVHNSRSMIGRDNLISAIRLAALHPRAAGATYLVSDQQDVSTPKLLSIISECLGRRARLWPVPVSALSLAGRLFGLEGEIRRLTDSLTVDSVKLTAELGWRPEVELGAGIRQMTDAWKQDLE